MALYKVIQSVRGPYVVDCCIGVAFTLAVAVYISSAGTASDYANVWRLYLQIWGPLFITSAASHMILKRSIGQRVYRLKVVTKSGAEASRKKLIDVTLLRQVPGIVVVLSEYVIGLATDLNPSSVLYFAVIIGLVFWLVWSDMHCVYRILGLEVVPEDQNA